MSTDADIILSSHADPRTFALIFERHFDAIHRYLHRRVGWMVADDLAAETFVVAFAERARYDQQREDARPWLYGIATNLLRRHHRSEVRQLRAYARTGVDAAIELDVEALAERLDALAVGSRVAAALAALSQGDRDVLLLYGWADLSYQDIGHALDIPVGTVRSRLHRARRQVRELLGLSGQYLNGEHDAPKSREEVLDGRA